MTEQIAASIEDVKSLLDNNRSLSIALLSRRLKDLENGVQTRFRVLEAGIDKRMKALNCTTTTLEERLKVAGVKFNEMQEELDKLRGGTNSGT